MSEELIRAACEAANCKYPDMEAMANFKREVTPSVVIGLIDGLRHAKGMAAINDARANGAAETVQHLRLELAAMRDQQSSQWGEAVAWRRRDGVMGCKRFMTQKCYDAQSPQMKGYYEPFYCAHCVSGKSSPAAKFAIGDRVLKTKGSQWRGTVVGTYSTALTPEGYAVESSAELGSVQIYPAAALEACE